MRNVVVPTVLVQATVDFLAVLATNLLVQHPGVPGGSVPATLVVITVEPSFVFSDHLLGVGHTITTLIPLIDLLDGGDVLTRQVAVFATDSSGHIDLRLK